MVILWSTTETGKIYRATVKSEIPDGAFMFSLDGEYLGKKKSSYLDYYLETHPDLKESIILWRMSEDGYVFEAGSKMNVPSGAQMFNASGSYLGVKAAPSAPIQPKRQHILTSESIL